MLTHEVDIAFSPQSRVGSLAVSDDGKIIAWSESDQSVNISVEKEKAQKISIESDVIPGLIKKNKICYLINKSKIFFDIGIPKDLNKFKQYIKKNKLINSRNFKQ